MLVFARVYICIYCRPNGLLLLMEMTNDHACNSPIALILNNILSQKLYFNVYVQLVLCCQGFLAESQSSTPMCSRLAKSAILSVSKMYVPRVEPRTYCTHRNEYTRSHNNTSGVARALLNLGVTTHSSFVHAPRSPKCVLLISWKKFGRHISDRCICCYEYKQLIRALYIVLFRLQITVSYLNNAAQTLCSACVCACTRLKLMSGS